MQQIGATGSGDCFSFTQQGGRMWTDRKTENADTVGTKWTHGKETADKGACRM